ncbi:MAG: hypothetical protein JOS17DRAFT_804546 [Linnemannia elongata]|nr:MAG: hypothetical protein JOS17DRAFT_804546 [Linnemannia elongata]
MRTTALATTAILWFGAIATVAPLYVAAEGIICHGGSAQVEFNPGVTFRKQDIQIQANGDLGACSSDQAPKITGGTFRFVGSATGACPGPFGVGNGKIRILWNDGTQSDVPQTSFRAEAFTASIEGGTVSEGMFKGNTFRMNGGSTSSAIEMGAQCATSGLNTYAFGIDSFAIGSI